MSDWTNAGLDPRIVCGLRVQTIRYNLTNETGHEVAVGGLIVRVLPDGRTTSKKRSWVISRSIEDARALLAGTRAATIASHRVARPVLDLEDPLEARAIEIGRGDSAHDRDLILDVLVGRLILAGATRLEVSHDAGETWTPIVPRSTSTIRWTIDVDDDGIHLRHTGGDA